MNKNHFFIPYYGNKRQEVEKIYNFIEPKLNSIEYIIEPFCGSSAFSYYVALKHPKKFKYLLNDNNKFLYELYNIALDDNKMDNLIKELKAKLERVKTKEDYLKEIKDWNKDGNLINYIFANKVYSIRPALYPQNKKFTPECFDAIKNAPIINFLKTENVKFTNIDCMEVYNEYKNNKKALIFIDPPYLSSNNDWYNCPDVNIYEYLYENDIKKEKALIVLCLENIWIIKLLFKGKKQYEYDKKYETTKKLTKHIIITNEKCLKE